MPKNQHECERCDAFILDVNVEAWETTGEFLCEDCAEAAFAEAAEEDPSPTPEGA